MLSSCRNILIRFIKKGLLPEECYAFVDEVCEGAVRGLDLEQFKNLEEWAEWLSWAFTVLDDKDYLVAAIHALRLAPELVATDYGTARQRDLGQLWTDTIRGFLGEISFTKWLKERFGVSASLDFRKGRLEEFLPSDIKEVNGRAPKLNISIKTTKFRGIWLDVPYAQVKHSDIFVLVRVGVTREHFIAFLKKISVIKEKILKEALELGIVSESVLSEIWNKIPEFTRVPAYVAGFIDKREFAERLEKERVLIVDGKIRGKDRKRLTINKFLGFWHPESEEYRRIVLEKCQGSRSGSLSSKRGLDIEFEGIGGFSKTLHFIASSGILKKKKHEWEAVIKKI